MEDIIGYIILAFIALLLMTFLVLTIIAAVQQENDEKEYIKKLNDHDKKIIYEYKNLTRWFPKIKKGEKDGK